MNIATRVHLLGPLLVLATACSVGLVSWWGYRTLIAEQRVNALEAQVEAETRRLEPAMKEIQNDVRLLSHLPVVRVIVDGRGGAGIAEAGDFWKDQAANAFAAMLETKPHYDQIRLIGISDDGREIVRVDRRQGRPVRVPKDRLQSKAHRDYFRAALKVPPERVYVSDVSLNREFGALEVPHRPMLRASAPLDSNDGRRFGMVIINVNFRSFMNELFPVGNNEFNYYLTNSEGDYVLHPDPERSFGFDLGERHRIQEDFPALADVFVSAASSATTPVALPQRGNGLIHARRLSFAVDEPERFMVLAMAVPMDDIVTTGVTIGTRVMIVTLALLLLAVLVVYILALRLTRPLEKLTASASRVANHEAVDLPCSERNDEIGTLSRALDGMVTSLRQTQVDLREANKDLEYFSRIASHDLTEPARRMAALADLLQVEEQEHVSEEGLDILRRLRAGGLKMIGQLTELRAFSRLSQGPLLRQQVDLKHMIQDVLAAYEEAITSRGVKITVDETPHVRVYRNLIELVYNNLIDNALRHVKGNGFTMSFTYELQSDEHVFGVRNTGSTIEGVAEAVFEPFHQRSSSEDRAGLGLSICRHIIERHAGRIWVEIGPDHVHFRFTLAEGESVLQ